MGFRATSNSHTPYTSVSLRCRQRGTGKVRVAGREPGEQGGQGVGGTGVRPPTPTSPSTAKVTLKLKLSIVFCRLHWTRGRSLDLQRGTVGSGSREG